MGTVRDVTLRDDVRSALAGETGPVALDLDHLPAELVGTLLGHFADTAPIDEATALSPIVMATSHVPLDPQLDGVDVVDDPRAELAATEVVASPVEQDVADRDPALLDGADEPAPSGESSDPSAFDRDPAGDPSGDDVAPEFDVGFGGGAAPADEPGPVGEQDSANVDSSAGSHADTFDAEEFHDPVLDLEDDAAHEPALIDLDFEPDPLDVDPMDDGFDLAD